MKCGRVKWYDVWDLLLKASVKERKKEGERGKTSKSG